MGFLMICLLLLASESLQAPQNKPKKIEPNPFMKKKVEPNPFMPQPKKVEPNPYVKPKKVEENPNNKPVAPPVDNGCAENDDKCVPKALLDKMSRISSIADFQKEFNLNDGVKALPRDASQGTCKKADVFKVVGKADPKSKIMLDGTPASSTSTSAATIEVPTDTGCVPRWELYSIPKPVGTYMVWPSCVYTKQCGGCCTNNDMMECVPTRLGLRKAGVYKIPYNMYNAPTVDQMDIVDHKECGCRCRVGADTCIGQQTYDAQNCQCTCPQYLSEKNRCQPGTHWSSSECDCKCDIKRDCYSSNRKLQWNDKKCVCECAPIQCAAGQMLDPHTCICVGF